MAPPKKVNWWHTEIVTWMLGHPDGKLRECAEHFGVTQPWLSTIINCDAFKDYAGKRMKEHHSLVSISVIEQVEGLGALSLDILAERFERKRDSVPLGIVKETADMALKALGYGSRVSVDARGARNVNIALVDPVDLARARGHLRARQEADEADAPAQKVAALPAAS